MKIIYIAGPITAGWDGKDRGHIERHILAAEEYQIKLVNADVGAFCPHTHTAFHFEKGGTAPEEYYYKLDLEILRRATDAVLAIPGWEKSSGARFEVQYAKEHNLPIFYPKSPDDLEEVINWAKK